MTTHDQVENGQEAAERILSAVKAAVSAGLLTSEQVFKHLGVRPKGRAARPLPEFTFPGSGVVVQIRRMGPFTLESVKMALAAEKEIPKPPKVQVNYGTQDKPEYHWEENPADPKYAEELIKYQAELGEQTGRRVIDLIIKHAVEVDPDPEEVRNTREFLIDLGTPAEDVERLSDKELYIKHVCIVSGLDLVALQQFVIGQSVPTEERIKAHEDSFRGNVSGQATEQVSGSTLRDEV